MQYVAKLDQSKLLLKNVKVMLDTFFRADMLNYDIDEGEVKRPMKRASSCSLSYLSFSRAIDESPLPPELKKRFYEIHTALGHTQCRRITLWERIDQDSVHHDVNTEKELDAEEIRSVPDLFGVHSLSQLKSGISDVYEAMKFIIQLLDCVDHDLNKYERLTLKMQILLALLPADIIKRLILISSLIMVTFFAVVVIFLQ